jgi:hypothetical protein
MGRRAERAAVTRATKEVADQTQTIVRGDDGFLAGNFQRLGRGVVRTVFFDDEHGLQARAGQWDSPGNLGGERIAAERGFQVVRLAIDGDAQHQFAARFVRLVETAAGDTQPGFFAEVVHLHLHLLRKDADPIESGRGDGGQYRTDAHGGARQGAQWQGDLALVSGAAVSSFLPLFPATLAASGKRPHHGKTRGCLAWLKFQITTTLFISVHFHSASSFSILFSFLSPIG